MSDRDVELQFLPAALEIQQSPPSPAGRAVLWTLIALLVVAIAWACFGHVDIVAVAAGKLVPSSRVKVIQPVGIGRVRAIHVIDGQSVHAGEALLELDPTLADADRERLGREVQSSNVELARLQAFAHWLETGRREPLKMPEGNHSPTATALQNTLLDQQIAEQRAKVGLIDNSLARKRADLDGTRQVLEKLQQTLPLIAQRAESLRTLSASNLVARNTYLEVEQQRIEAEHDLSAQQASLRSTEASIEELSQQRSAVIAEARRTTLASIEELETRASGQTQEFVKAREISGQQILTAPVDGVVQQLAVHTIGGVVTPAEALMVVVPKDQPLEVEARVLNKDIGFVREGQPATVKLEAFPFTRYGTVEGKVVTVSRDAVADEKLGLYYVARVRLGQTTMNIDGADVALSAGMAVSAEVATGRRRLIEYFLSPVVRSVRESARER